MFLVFINMLRNIELEEKVVNDYLLGINNKELCLKYDKSRSYIQKTLKRYDVVLRKGSDVSKKYDINENYFEEIDNNNKAYILGLLYADGTIFKTTAKINLIYSDNQILYDIANEIYNDKKYQIKNVEGRLKKWKNGKYYYSKKQTVLLLTRKKIVTDLIKHGCYANKTFKIRYPIINFHKDFIRGYFDGDGCFYVSNKYKNNNRINITANNLFILDLFDIIKKEINIEGIITETKIKNINRLNIYGNKKVKKFLDWMYNDSNLKLNRKYEKYCDEYINE